MAIYHGNTRARPTDYKPTPFPDDLGIIDASRPGMSTMGQLTGAFADVGEPGGGTVDNYVFVRQLSSRMDDMHVALV